MKTYIELDGEYCKALKSAPQELYIFVCRDRPNVVIDRSRISFFEARRKLDEAGVKYTCWEAMNWKRNRSVEGIKMICSSNEQTIEQINQEKTNGR